MAGPNTTPARALRLVLLGIVLGTFGCAEPTEDLLLAEPDRAQFEAMVYPVLLRDCGFHACHGSSERFYQVFGPGRGRLDPLTQPLDAFVTTEIDFSYRRARSLIDPRDPEHSVLLLKPLAVEAGGAGHQGVDDFGRDIYLDSADPGYQALKLWVMSQAAAPAVPLPGQLPGQVPGQTTGPAPAPTPMPAAP